MIDIEKAKKEFKKFLEEYGNQEELGFELKVIHTYQVVQNSKTLAQKLNLGQEDIGLAELIGLLHDIGRFEELKMLSKFDSTNFDHAEHGVKMLFENNLIRKFVEDNQYDEIIKQAIQNHNKLKIEKDLDERTLLHCKIIRDSDKLDNFRVKQEEKIEAMFPKIVKTKEELENAEISEPVYESIKSLECVKLKDRKTPLDYLICILAFTFDLNFPVSYQTVKDYDYINGLIDRFDYKIPETKEKMEEIRRILNQYSNKQI